MLVYVEKSGDMVGCYHSGTDRQTNKQGKKELLMDYGLWTAEMSKWSQGGPLACLCNDNVFPIVQISATIQFEASPAKQI